MPREELLQPRPYTTNMHGLIKGMKKELLLLQNRAFLEHCPKIQLWIQLKSRTVSGRGLMTGFAFAGM